MKAVQKPAPAEKRIHSVKLTTEHVEAQPCQDHDPFWLILRHVNMDLQFVENQVTMQVRS